MLISVITLGVADLDRSERFYAQGLGLPTSRDRNGVVYVGESGTRLALYHIDSLEAYSHCALSRDSRSPAVTLSHNVATPTAVDTMCAAAVTAGASLIRAPGVAFWGGRIAWFKDPDGMLWEVVFNPKRCSPSAVPTRGDDRDDTCRLT